MRLQLAGPQLSLLTPEMYDQIFTMHGITMIFWYAQPILSGLAILQQAAASAIDVNKKVASELATYKQPDAGGGSGQQR